MRTTQVMNDGSEHDVTMQTGGSLPGWTVGPMSEVTFGVIGCAPTEHAFHAVQSYVGGMSMVVGVLCPKCGEYRPLPTPELPVIR